MIYRLLLTALLLLQTANAFGVGVTGRVRVVGRPTGQAVPIVVFAEALDAKPGVAPEQFTMGQKNKSFGPRVLAVPVGSTVNFPNDDLIFHNVFSLSRPAPFDLGLYRAGESKSRTFTAPAIYRVFCNIHPQMAAVILVLPTPFITQTDPTGSYRLDLPPGRYRVSAWSERAETSVVEMVISATSSSMSELTLDESKFVEAGHKNKFGKDYPPGAGK
jgi:plastocyanin